MNKWATKLLWGVYFALLGVLLPHTAWAFAMFEQEGSWYRWILGYTAAIAFEGAIAALTFRLKQRIEETPRKHHGWKKVSFQYLNVIGGGLFITFAVSSAANWAHAVQYGQTFDVFTTYNIPAWVYAIAFGGILPLCSFLFARILADVQHTEQEIDPALHQAHATIKELRSNVREAERRAKLAEQRIEAIGDLAIMLTAENKRDRIRAVQERWSELPTRSVAIIAGASPSYVSEVEKNGQ